MIRALGPFFIAMSRFEQIENIIGPLINSMGYELWACMLVGPKGKQTLRVYIDSDAGIQLEDCQKVSHQLSLFLEAEQKYNSYDTLEVSSPGLDRPLLKIEHFQRFVGSKVSIKLFQPLDGQKNYLTEIKEVNAQEQEIIIDVDGANISVPFVSIAKASLVF